MSPADLMAARIYEVRDEVRAFHGNRYAVIVASGKLLIRRHQAKHPQVGEIAAACQILSDHSGPWTAMEMMEILAAAADLIEAPRN